MEDLNIHIATINGTGSLSANQLLSKVLFRSGWTVGTHNFFPSNIAGLPCLYSLRLNSQGWTGFSEQADVLIQLNPKNKMKELKNLKPDGLMISDEKDKVCQFLNEEVSFHQQSKTSNNKLPSSAHHWIFPISESLKQIENISVKKRVLFKNMIYVGLLCEWLNIKEDLIIKTVEDLFQSSKGSEIVQQNLQAIQIGRNLAHKKKFPFPVPKKNKFPKKKLSKSTQSDNSLKLNLQKEDILIDGNTSMALGALFAGCQFLSWYPITPASSLAESFEKFANKYKTDKNGKKNFLVLQAEDELAAIAHTIGAGWAGIRAMTVTSGPGLSLMSEGAGLSYFSEIPAVLCNIQRAGPSTGLPTRTQQGDLLSSCFLSHGDSKHIVLIPGTPEEAFSLTAQAFDLAEELQTLVIVLSDLDLGMNLKPSRMFQCHQNSLKRGKVLREKDLENKNFSPYEDPEKDGISYRTLPGIRHPKGAYLNRGSGHNKKADYSETPEDYFWKLDKLERKWQTAKTLMPEPITESSKNQNVAFVTFGSNDNSLKELRETLEKENILTNFIRIRSFPFPKSVELFLKEQSEVFVVEQNRDAQLKQLLSGEFPQHSKKMKSLLQYDGRPLMVSHIKKQFDNLYQQKREGRKIY